MLDEWKELQAKIDELLAASAERDPRHRRADDFVAAVGDGQAFEKGRDVAAWLGLVPREYSTGGKQRLGGISKRGNRYVRTLLVHCARSGLETLSKRTDQLGQWLRRMRKDRRVVIVALAAQAGTDRLGLAEQRHTPATGGKTVAAILDVLTRTGGPHHGAEEVGPAITRHILTAARQASATKSWRSYRVLRPSATMSSRKWDPGSIVADHGIERNQELTSDGNQCDLLRLTDCEQAGAEDHSARGAGRQQRHTGAACGDPPPAAELPAITGQRCQTGQRGGLSGAELSQLRQIGQQGVLGPMPGAVRSCVARWHAAGCSRSACSTCCSSSAISWLNEAITRSALAKTAAPCSCHLRVRCWARRPTSASRWRSNSRRSRNCRLGKRVAAGRSRSPNSANTRASSRSVFASSPNERAKSRTRLGFTTATRNPAASSAAHTAVSNPPVASKTTNCGSNVASSAASAISSRPRRGRWPLRSALLLRTKKSTYPLETSMPTMIGVESGDTVGTPFLVIRALGPQRLSGVSGRGTRCRYC